MTLANDAETVSFQAKSLRHGVQMLRDAAAAGQRLLGYQIPGGWHLQYVIGYLDDNEAVKAALDVDTTGVAALVTGPAPTAGNAAPPHAFDPETTAAPAAAPPAAAPGGPMTTATLAAAPPAVAGAAGGPATTLPMAPRRAAPPPAPAATLKKRPRSPRSGSSPARIPHGNFPDSCRRRGGTGGGADHGGGNNDNGGSGAVGNVDGEISPPVSFS